MKHKIVLVPRRGVSGLFHQVGGELAQRGVEIVSFASDEACVKDLEARRNAVAVLAMHDFPATREFLSSMPQLRGVLSFVTGTEGYDEHAATDLGIVVANGQIPENYHSMAEATLMLMLAGLYDLNSSQQQLRENLPPPGQFRATMLMGKTVGIVGFGKIAQALLERLQGWGVKIQVYAPRLRSPLPSGVVSLALDDLLRGSDVICVLANLSAQTRHLLNKQNLNLIKKGAVLVNTARGGLIDECALIQSVRERQFKAVALDTFEQEPLPAESPLRDLPGAILTPHCVGHTVEAHVALVRLAIDNLTRLLRGELPSNIRNPDVQTLWERRWGGST